MAKSYPFSIYLLKTGYGAREDKDHEILGALEDDHGLLSDIEAAKLPKGASLFVGDVSPKSPWWKGYFGINKSLYQSLKSALVFIPVSNRCFVLSFGHAYNKLRDESYEYDFGLRVTLNCIDPNKLKSTDTLEPDTSRRRRTQIPNVSNITFYDFDKEGSILKNISGKVDDKYKKLFSNTSGTSNLRINSSRKASEILDLLTELLGIYDMDEYREKFPNLLSITPVRDPKELCNLNKKLLSGFIEKNEALYLTVPEIIDYHEDQLAKFHPLNKSDIYEGIFLDSYYEHLKKQGIALNKITIEYLKNKKVALMSDDWPKKEFSIFKCLIYETSLDDEEEFYHLNEGHWYKIEKNYLTKISKYLDSFYKKTSLPDYSHDNEAQYNQSVEENDPSYLCLDQKNISPDGQSQMEPCDLYRGSSTPIEFIHVKRSTRAIDISHLLNQGINSAHAIRSFDESRKKINELIAQDSSEPHKLINKTTSFSVSFVIITHKDASDKSKNFPFFSKISFKTAMEELERMGLKASYEFVKNTKKNPPS